MLPAKYINELRNVAPSELSSLDAQYNVRGFFPFVAVLLQRRDRTDRLI